jgi:hypothetical protein
MNNAYGWRVTAIEIKRINNFKAKYHFEAVNDFYTNNFSHLKALAISFFRQPEGERLSGVVDVDDLLQQVYIDLLDCCLKLSENERAITKAIWLCFRFSAVGGLAGVDNV